MASGQVSVHWTAPDGTTRLVGQLTVSGQHDFQRFRYDTSWLAAGRFSVGEGLPATIGTLVPPGGATEFGVLRDATPNAWGRRIIAAKPQPTPHTGTGFLLAAADETRQGALRLKDADGSFLAEGGAEPLTTLTDLRHEVKLFQTGDPDVTGRLVHLLRAGTSQGGFRPKAAVVDEHGRLWIAKFPMETDSTDIEALEAAALHVARESGLNVPEFRHIRVDIDHSILLVARFDRTDRGRLGYQSMATAMRLGEDEPYDYQQMAATAGYLAGRKGRLAVVAAAALNITVNNADDHAYNVGFLQDQTGRWAPAPLFDIVPRTIPGAPGTPLANGDADRSIEHLLDLDWGLPRCEVEELTTRIATAARNVFRVAVSHYAMDPEAAENGERNVASLANPRLS